MLDAGMRGKGCAVALERSLLTWARCVLEDRSPARGARAFFCEKPDFFFLLFFGDGLLLATGCPAPIRFSGFLGVKRMRENKKSSVGFCGLGVSHEISGRIAERASMNAGSVTLELG